MQLTSCLGGRSSRLVPRRAVAGATVRVPAPKMLGPHIPKLPSARGARAACRAEFSNELMLSTLVFVGLVVPCALLSSFTTSVTTSIKGDIDTLKADLKGDIDTLKADLKADLKAADDRWAVAETRWYTISQRVAALEVAVTGQLPVTKAPGDV